MTDLRADVAVIGLGAMGAATLYQLARRGARVVGLDQEAPPHARGSSHGETRITRRAVGEGDAYVPFVRRSHEIWRDLERESGQALLEEVGCLVMAPRDSKVGHHGKTDFLGRTVAVARRHAIAHELLDARAIAARFPAFTLTGEEAAYFEPGGGFVHPERCITAALRAAMSRGAEVVTGRQVRTIIQRSDHVVIETDTDAIEARRAVVCAGSWAGGLLGAPYDRLLVPYRQVLHWFPVADPAAHAASGSPVFIWMYGPTPTDYFYGFPAMAGATEVKVATEQYDAPCDPDLMDRTVGPEEAADMGARVAGRLAGVAPRPARSVACLYTVTPDSGFVVGPHPTMDRVVVVSACSGHGFKHSAGLGEAVAQLLHEGRSDADLSPFAWDRFGTHDPDATGRASRPAAMVEATR